MKKISILGCGWLGRPLAHMLLFEGFYVSGSTTSAEKLTQLKQEGIEAWLIKTEASGVAGDWSSFIENADWLMVNIPPAMKKNGSEYFLASMQKLCKQIEQSAVTKIILVSSTSVFPDIDQTFTELNLAQPDSENGKVLLAVEEMFQKIPSANTTIIRFGGLIGAHRHPVKYLAGRTEIASPLAPVNLIHLDDCIGIITSVIKTDFYGKIIHGVSPYHPSRAEYYTQKALELGLALPVFDATDTSSGKTINSIQLTQKLGYRFIKPEL
jgi:nucleoside-diphosphate-sugar epimerase